MGRCPGVRFSGWGEKKNLGRPQGQEKNQGISFKNGRIRTSNSLFCTHGMHFITNESQKFSANAGRDPFSLLLYLITGLSSVNINGWGGARPKATFQFMQWYKLRISSVNGKNMNQFMLWYSRRMLIINEAP